MKAIKYIYIYSTIYRPIVVSIIAFFLTQIIFHLLVFHQLPLIYYALYSFKIYFIYFFMGLLLSLPILTKIGKWITFIFLIALTILCYSNLLYYRAFGDIIPISSYFIVGNLHGFEKSLIPIIHPLDTLFLFPIIIYIINIIYSRKIIINKKDRLKISILSFSFLIIVSPFIFTKNIFQDQCKDIGDVKKYGLIPRVGYKIYRNIKISSDLTSEDKALITNYIQAKKIKYSHSNPLQKNIILILVESLESWPLSQKIDNQEITPNINIYLKETKKDSIIFFSKVRTQVRGGRSSDAQVLFNTGLLPIKEGAACFQYAFNIYPNLAKELKRHNIFKKATTMMGYSSDEWNQKEFNSTLGFDDLIYQKDYSNSFLIWGGVNDKSFLLESVYKMSRLPQPFYAQLITLSSHSPFQIPESCKELKINKKQFNNTFTDYIHSIHYVDKAVGKFIAKLKKLKLYDKSIIVITGDHNTGQPMELSEWEQNYAATLCGKKAYIPFIVLNAPLSFRYDDEVDQVDLYPTMLDIMGVNAKWRGLGQSVLSKNYKEILNKRDKAIQNSNGKPTIWDVSDILITKNYFAKNKSFTY
nr:LTA synthase family protein [uncultured Bacteroides sp.]